MKVLIAQTSCELNHGYSAKGDKYDASDFAQVRWTVVRTDCESREVVRRVVGESS
jgi:hypothetical protein